MTDPRPIPFVCAFALAICLLAAPAAVAQRADLSSSAAVVPDDVDLLVAVDGAAEWRRGPSGPALTALTTGLLRSQDGTAAWGRFAAQLGLDEEIAFDRLLGTRIVFARRGAGPNQNWVLVSTIDRETERLLRQRLQAAPRRVQQGLPIMAIEDGRFWIASSVRGDKAQIVLGPAEDPALFDEVAGAVANPPRVRVDPPGPARQLLQKDAEARALIVARLPIEEGGWIGASVTPDGRSFSAQFVIESPALAVKDKDVEPWSRSAFDALSPDAFWKSIDWPGGTGSDIARTLGIDEALDWAQPLGALDMLDGRYAVVVSPADDALATVVLSWEASDVEALARAGDEAVSKAVGPLLAGAPDAPAIGLGGAFPGAARNVDLGQTPAGQLLRPIFDSGPVLSWSFIRQQTPHGPDPRGWWTLGLGKRAVSDVSRALTGAEAEEGPRLPWVSLGSARPSAFVRELKRRGVSLPESVRPLLNAGGLVERVEWELLRTGERTITGRGVLIVEPSSAAP